MSPVSQTFSSAVTYLDDLLFVVQGIITDRAMGAMHCYDVCGSTVWFDISVVSCAGKKIMS